MALIFSGPFQGTKLVLSWKSSKRKILGVYEHNLNQWFQKKLPKVEVSIDVGANDGYFTYGSAHNLKKHQGNGTVVAFEPGLVSFPKLRDPQLLKHYEPVRLEFIPKFVGAQNSSNTVTLDAVWQEHPHLHSHVAMVKVDVEGAELDVLAGASSLLVKPHQWVVEVHGDHLLEPVLQYFSKHERNVEVIEDKPHWLFGPEARTIKTSWVVTLD